ncbi:glutaredoxin family protein [Candidatus Woesearchaeota archaeon]|nr:glutaredoxin family protein [Candidatus Woesearchaeota archaeon]MBW3022091.1 glutaredoxin family protein [Candidatus Woesearchaeota archaeon]
MVNVIVFTTPTCPYCKMAKEFLTENKIEYEERDVSVDQEAAKEMIEKSGQQGVPVILVDEEVVVGFDEPRLRELLNI